MLSVKHSLVVPSLYQASIHNNLGSDTVHFAASMGQHSTPDDGSTVARSHDVLPHDVNHPDRSPAEATFREKDDTSIEFHKNNSLDELSDSEKTIFKRELHLPPVKVSYRTLFRYASRVDLMIMAICLVCAVISGAVMPLMTVCHFDK